MVKLSGSKFQKWQKSKEGKLLLKDHNEHAKIIRDKLSKDKIKNWTLEDLYEIYNLLWANSNFGAKKWRCLEKIIKPNVQGWSEESDERIAKKKFGTDAVYHNKTKTITNTDGEKQKEKQKKNLSEEQRDVVNAAYDLNGALEKIKTEITKLVYDNKSVSERYDNCAANLKGLDKGTLTEFLYCHDRKKYVLWNRMSDNWIKHLGLEKKVKEKGKSKGQWYEKLIEEYDKILTDLKPFGASDFFDIDSFLYSKRDEVSDGDSDPDKQNYWVCAVGRIDERNGTWDEIKNKTYWGMGWDKMEDLSKYKTDDEILKAFKKAYPQNGIAEKKKTKGQACVDIKKINAGDTLFINDGKLGLFGVGVATGTYEYHPEAELMHQVPVKWISKQYVEWIK